MSPLYLILLIVAVVLGVFLLRSLAQGRDYSTGPARSERPTRDAEADGTVEMEPTYIYCPECGDEYFSDVTHCFKCMVPLEAEPPAPADEEQLVRLVESRDIPYLDRVRRALTAAGIFHVADRESVGLIDGFGGIRVRPSDRESAAEVLFELQRQEEDFGEDFNTWVPEDDPEVLRTWEEQGGVRDLDDDPQDSMESESS